jgi:hypothetical protein
VVAKPEEVVRQLCLKRLLELGYSLGQMSLDRLATSPRSGRERVAQGGAAAATLGTASSVEPARGNGRQNRQFLALSPTVWALAVGLPHPGFRWRFTLGCTLPPAPQAHIDFKPAPVRLTCVARSQPT